MIIPKPNHIELGTNKYYVNKLLVNNQTNFDFSHILNKIDETLCKYTGVGKKINLILDTKINGYELLLSSEITISSSSEENLHYGLVSLYQLTIQDSYFIEQKIIDQPNYSWRGMMLDVSRHFFSKKVVLELIDLMALHKLNVLHLHLSDDHGFRIESLKFPRLTEISTKRNGSTFNKNTINDKEYSGYFTQKDIKEIVAYAHVNYIKVVPEIDVPGHITAILAAYPELSCLEEEKQVATGIGYYQTSLCMSNKTKVSFMLDIIEEIAELFPDKLIHFGGDEASLKKTFACPSCMDIVKSGKYENTILFKMLFDEIRARFHPKGYTIINWNDIWPFINSSGEKHYTQIWSFVNSKGIYSKIPNAHTYSINSNSRYFYADFSYKVIEMKSTYNYNIDKGVIDKSYLLGGEMAIWTEFIDNEKKLYEQLLPRLTAFSENLWTNKEKKNYREFLGNKATIIKLYNAIGIRDYTDFNKTSAQVLKGNFLYPLRVFIASTKRFGILNLIKFVIKGELPFDDPADIKK